MHSGPAAGVFGGMKHTPSIAAAFLALGYVHYAAVRVLGGNPALVVVWLVLFVGAGGVALKHTLDQA